MNELEKFEMKAIAYRHALDAFPSARLLEVYPILSLLLQLSEERGTPISNLKIVDLMSGSGFLSRILYDCGCRSIHAIEFCDAMCNDSPIYASKVRLHRLSSFDHLEGVLDEIRPDIVISLASFHHLIEYSQNGDVDRDNSVALQTRVVDICMRALGSDGVMVICDLFDETVADSPVIRGRKNIPKVLRLLTRCGASEELVSSLSACRSILGTSSCIHRLYGISTGNPSLSWFRNIVDKRSSLGHKDIAISRSLQERISHHQTWFARYNCPWIFSSSEDAENFAYEKFGFSLDAVGGGGLPKNQVLEEARKVLGVKDTGRVTALGWSLGVLVIGGIDNAGRAAFRGRVILTLSFIVFILGVAVILRHSAGIYAGLDAKDLFVTLLSIPIGYIFGEWAARWRER